MLQDQHPNSNAVCVSKKPSRPIERQETSNRRGELSGADEARANEPAQMKQSHGETHHKDGEFATRSGNCEEVGNEQLQNKHLDGQRLQLRRLASNSNLDLHLTLIQTSAFML